VEIAEKRELWLYYAPSMRNGPQTGEASQDRGNAILSTLPLSGFKAIELPFERQRRVALSANVAISGIAKLQVTTVHLDTAARFSNGWLLGGDAIRNRQMTGLVGSMNQFPGAAVIVAGDLNGGAGQKAVETLNKFVNRRQDCKGPTYHILRVFGQTLDHVFVRLPETWKTTTCRLLNKSNSDHAPFLLTINVPG
jgi:endonuclease/exonuclease/phosphatase family metal-dependent hydrolase